MFIARTFDKHDRVQYNAMEGTREDAALAVFALDPAARVCQTVIARKLQCGDYWNTGEGERWHRPDDFPTPNYPYTH